MLVAAGCLAQRYREEIREELPEVDALVGTMAAEEIAEAIEEALAGGISNHYRDLNAPLSVCGDRVVTTGGH